MHTVKVILLLLAVLAAMRATSWFLTWAIRKLVRRDHWLNYLAANVLGFLGFLALLEYNRFPGEPVDTQGVAFGAVVFGLCLLLDLAWRRWVTSQRAPQPPR